MAIKAGTVKTSINTEMNDLRKERNSDVSRSLRKWREEHPNPFIESVYCNLPLPKEK